MSTSERWTNTYAPCPCGAGSILEHVDSPDNPWSSVGREYELSCDKCEKQWVLEGRELHDREAFEANRQAFDQLRKVEKEIDTLGTLAIDQIVQASLFPDHKSEYKALTGARICNEGPIRYPRARRDGKSASSMCQPRKNLSWIIEQVGEGDTRDALNELESRRASHETDYQTSKSNLNTIRIQELRPSE